MRRTPGAALVGIASAVAVAAALAAPASTASADPSGPARPAGTISQPGSDTKELGPDYKMSKLDRSSVRSMRGRLNTARATGNAAPGDVKTFVALDFISGSPYLKEYTLRGIGNHVEVWVATDIAFPDGDCRNDLGMTKITGAQVTRFVKEFDTNIYPKESASFSVPPALDGSEATLPGLTGMPADYYQVGPKQADDIVVLVDNVQDENFFDPGTPDGQTFVAGFFSGSFNDYIGRNVMTIDASDWRHRTGANPPDDTNDPAYAACAESQGYPRPYGAPHPRDYEGTFAHEYQHLLEHYEDVDEANWINEGLSDYAQTLVGYVDTRIPPTGADTDGHIACFDGYLGRSYGGPENSLTMWEDQGGPEVLCDYGAAYSFMMYLYSHYGERFMSALHRQNANGMDGLNKVLDRFKSKKSAKATIHDWAATMALDAALDRSHKLNGGNRNAFTAKWLSSFVNWKTPQAYSSPGAPPNGSDYVRLRKGSKSVKASQLKSINFKGAATLAPTPLEWTVDATPPDTIASSDGTCGTALTAGTGAAALYSGCGENLDRSMVREVTVPAGGGQLSFDTLYDAESEWDFGFVQVSTNGGKTWKSLATEDTTSTADPAADSKVVANLPGFSGESGGWKTEHADLSSYAGKQILVGFRYITDGAVDEAGFWVRNVDVAGTALPTGSLSGWKTISQANPTKVSGWTVQLIGIRKNGESWIHRMDIDKSFRGHLGTKALHRELGTKAGTVAALVMMDDPSESAPKYGRYKLTVNGVLQPGG
jgi:Immune inhibitor A peptidase M6